MSQSEPGFYTFGPFLLDTRNKTLYRDELEISVEPKVFDLFQFLIKNIGETFSTIQLMDALWGEPFLSSVVVTQAIYKLRGILEDDRDLLNVRSKVGYRLLRYPVQDDSEGGPDWLRRRSEPQGEEFLSVTQTMSLSAAEASVERALLEYDGGHVAAIRLYGAADQCLSPDNIFVHYDHIRYLVPPELSAAGEERVKELQEAAKQGLITFFDGPCVRLLDWIASPPEQGTRAVLERDILHLHFAPVGWWDVERTNGVLRQQLLRGYAIQYERWIGLSKIATHLEVGQSQLSNLFGNAITIFTTDGKVGYQERGIFQSVGSQQLSSAVAENVNRYFDETDVDDSERLINPEDYEIRLQDGPNNDYAPRAGKPHPAAAVRRGLNEETSWRMTDFVPVKGIKCTGLCFGLDSLHPDALWIVLVNLTADEFEHECRTHKGKDWREGRIRFVNADFGDANTKSVLDREDWIAAGKASLVRAIELVTFVRHQGRDTVARIFDAIAPKG